MAKILLRLRNVPEDEAEEVRALLEAHEIEFYETSPGNWGISMPAIWLRDESQLEQARTLLKSYQQERAQRARQDYEARRQAGEAPTLADSFRASPLRFIGYCAAAAAVLYISISVFYSFN